MNNERNTDDLNHVLKEAINKELVMEEGFKALKIAKNEGVSPSIVGSLINDLNIKIASCQLGCFK